MIIKRNSNSLKQKDFSSKESKAIQNKLDTALGKATSPTISSADVKKAMGEGADQYWNKSWKLWGNTGKHPRYAKTEQEAIEQIHKRNGRIKRKVTAELEHRDPLATPITNKARRRQLEHRKYLKSLDAVEETLKKQAENAAKKKAEEAARAEASKASIARHKEVANALRVKKAKAIRNKVVLGVAATGLAAAGGVAAYKQIKKKKSQENQETDSK